MVTKKKDRNESNCLKKDEDLNKTKVNVWRTFFLKLVSNRTTIDCNQFYIKILKNIFFWYFKQKRKESKFFWEGKKTPKCSIKKTKNIDIPSTHRRRILQKTRQTVVVSVWGARSNAALGIFGLRVCSIVSVVLFPLLLLGGGGGGRGGWLCRFVFKV